MYHLNLPLTFGCTSKGYIVYLKYHGQNYQICIEELFNSGAYGLEKDGAIQVPFLIGNNTANCGSDVVEGACNYYLYPETR